MIEDLTERVTLISRGQDELEDELRGYDKLLHLSKKVTKKFIRATKEHHDSPEGTKNTSLTDQVNVLNQISILRQVSVVLKASFLAYSYI
jgi:hypothetical protein